MQPERKKHDCNRIYLLLFVLGQIIKKSIYILTLEVVFYFFQTLN